MFSKPKILHPEKVYYEEERDYDRVYGGKIIAEYKIGFDQKGIYRKIRKELSTREIELLNRKEKITTLAKKGKKC